jgi:hypothetical protein
MIEEKIILSDTLYLSEWKDDFNDLNGKIVASFRWLGYTDNKIAYINYIGFSFFSNRIIATEYFEFCKDCIIIEDNINEKSIKDKIDNFLIRAAKLKLFW